MLTVRLCLLLALVYNLVYSYLYPKFTNIHQVVYIAVITLTISYMDILSLMLLVSA